MNGKNDQEALIGDNKYTDHPILIFILLKSIPFLIYTSLNAFPVNLIVFICLNSLILFFEFYITRKVIGIQMVGLSWYIEHGHFQFYSRPNPYIPKATESNFFWISFPIIVIIWFIFILFHYYMIILIPLFGILSQLINLYFYISAYISSRKQNQIAVMAYLQDEPVNFPFVQEETNPEEKSNDQNENLQNDKTPPSNSIDENDQV